MKRFFTVGLLLTTSLSAAGFATAGAGTSPADNAGNITELFDPAAVARSVCGVAQGDPEKNAFIQLAAATAATAPMPAARPPLWQGLGTLSFKITTTKPEAQAYFDQGLRLAYAFNHAEAIRAFKAGQEIDPGCALCFWGEALALGPNINMAMPYDVNEKALAVLKKAQSLKAKVSAKEQALIDALAARYSTDPKATRKQLDQAFAAAMMSVHRAFPDDPEVAAIAIEAAMDVAPWDYWQPGGREPTVAMKDAYPLMEKLLAAHPNHPGAIHYYIHIMEQSAWPEKAVPPSDRLAALMPSAGHIVHMPSHIYFRVGRYKDALDSNIAAVKADEAFFAQAESDPVYKSGYYPHNIHFALESAAMAGDGPTTIAMAEKLSGVIPPEALRAVPLAQPIAVAAPLAHLRFSEPKVILNISDFGSDVPYMQGLWRYVRGSAHALNGDVKAATAELDALVTLQAKEDFSAVEDAAIPAKAILAVAEDVLRARIAGAKGDWSAAVTALEEAVKGQDALPYTEPAYWYYPARQSLGVALLKAGRAKDAVEVLRRSLMDAPNNGWALYALKEAAGQAGDAAGAAEYSKLFEKAWVGATPPALNRI
ncbi:MAG: hypothetical protein JNK21_07645 [Rhodospirillaceae bacterium]|nr:hypothetical protein [Rhodospirillaceae bacterium]